MAKIRINRDYGVAPNSLIDDERISLKAKGLYISIQNKPDDWNFSAIWLAGKSKDGKASIQSALQELEKFGWLERIKKRDEKWQWDIEYILHSSPTVTENQTPSVTENQTRHRDRFPVDGKSANNIKYKKQNTVINNSNELLMQKENFCTEEEEKDFEKNSETESEDSFFRDPEINSGWHDSENQEQKPKEKSSAKKEKTKHSDCAPTASFTGIRNLEATGTPKRTSNDIAERRAKILTFLRNAVGVSRFKDINEWTEWWRMEKLAEKLGKEEFLHRMQSILEDDFKAKNCNRLSYLRKEIECFIHSPKVPKKSSKFSTWTA